MGATQIAVSQVGGRPRAVLSSGLLRPQLVHGPPGRCRIGLVATTALLLGGDAVELRVTVGAGARLDLFDVAGTVAYDGRGVPSSWRVHVTLGDGAVLRMSGEPLVVADGADVTRSAEIEASGTATALIRDTLVLGRTHELGGHIRNRMSVRVDGRLVCLEDQQLDPCTRGLPGLLGDLRVVDTITTVGRCAPEPRPRSGDSVFLLTEGAGSLTRYLGRDLAPSTLHERWRDLMAAD